jgi:NH3-dependent NAD+ synthetase
LHFKGILEVQSFKICSNCSFECDINDIFCQICEYYFGKNNRNPRLLKFFCKIINESFKKYPIYNIISLYFGYLLRCNYKFILIIHIFFQNLQIKKSVAAAYLSRMRMCCLYAYAHSYSYVFISSYTAYAYACMKM